MLAGADSCSLGRVTSAAGAAILALAVGVSFSAQEAQGPVFRAAADLVVVDVHVVNRDGSPVPGLTADDFDVRIGGTRRRVVSAEFVRYGEESALVGVPESSAPREGVPGIAAGQVLSGRRLFMLAIDTMSFDAADSRGMVVAAQRFIDQLPDTDLVGLFAYPQGPRVEPTTDHAAVVRALDQVSGARVSAGRFSALQPSEIVDFLAGRDRDAITLRHCGADFNCGSQLASEIASMAGQLEIQAQAGLGMLRELVDRMAQIPDRKVLVLASAGVVASDRAGGRPDIGDLPEQVGQAAARANVTIYSLFVDHGMLRQFRAETRTASRQMLNVARESALVGRWLDHIAGVSGGTMIEVLVDSGDAAYARIARETAARYLLAVEPGESDRTGRPRRVQVRVNARNVTVRARQWVVLPNNELSPR